VCVAVVFVLSVVYMYFDGVPLSYSYGLGMIMFSCFGMVFGNVNAMAMEPIGESGGPWRVGDFVVIELF